MSGFSTFPNLSNSSVGLRINYQESRATEKIADTLAELMTIPCPEDIKITRVVLCIGSDRSTGDSLGPLVGSLLSRVHLPRTIVWGTLADPVHALNLNTFRSKLEKITTPLVIAVDASLGKVGNIGNIEVGAGPLYPGAGVNKSLPPVGDIHLSGIVNLGGFMEQMVLQSTRLHHVIEISEVIARAIQKALLRT